MWKGNGVEEYGGRCERKGEGVGGVDGEEEEEEEEAVEEEEEDEEEEFKLFELINKSGVTEIELRAGPKRLLNCVSNSIL